MLKTTRVQLLRTSTTPHIYSVHSYVNWILLRL